jgi:glycosyltransferase involved in cell wall biosynthesis
LPEKVAKKGCGLRLEGLAVWLDPDLPTFGHQHRLPHLIRLSLVMATRNAARFLPEALASIGPSIGDGVPVEVLVADGHSDDATVAIAAADPRTKVVSRADAGIYDGMNRALAAAGGDYVLFLNSDDALLPEAVEGAIRLLEQTPQAGWASAPALFGSSAESAVVRTSQSLLSVEGAMFGIPALNARLFRREVLAGLGPIRQELGLAADREFMARLARTGRQGLAMDTPLYLYRVHEGSQTIAGDSAGRIRVYQAELKLAQMLLGDAETAPELKRLARASGALAALKLRLAGDASGTKLADIGSPAALLHGLWLARRWRGRLSGY